MAESSTPSRKIQNLRSFTVQIRHIKTQAIVGTGFVVSEEGLIATCAHVVVAAGVNPRFGKIPSHWELIRQSFFPSSEALQTGTTATLPVYFPQAKQLPIAERTRYATVVGCFSESDDDLVLLKLAGLPLPEGVKVALVDRADESVNVADERRFRSY
ncbi:MAG: serine protease, partial [Leptolyngbya sp. DLM2.Bin27]